MTIVASIPAQVADLVPAVLAAPDDVLVLRHLLHQVAERLNAPHEPGLRSLGVSTGRAGLVLFNAHYAAFTGQHDYYESALTSLEQVLAALDPRTYKADFSSNYYQELVELGLLLDYLVRAGHLDWDPEPLLTHFDTLLADRLRHHLANQNLEARNGALSVGSYYVRRAAHSALARQQLDLLLDALQTLRQGDEASGYYWRCLLLGEPRAYTGTSHGSGMVLNFLVDVLQAGIRPEQCAHLLHYGTRWVLSTRHDPDCYISSFPLWQGRTEATPNLCLIYGDLGTAHAVLRAAIVLDNPVYRAAALEVVHRTIRRRTEADTYLRDASIYYGVSGTYLLYDALYRLAPDEPALAEAAAYWLSRVPTFADPSNAAEYLHFQPQFYANYPAACLGMGFGLVGIGLTLLYALSRGRHAFHAFTGLS